MARKGLGSHFSGSIPASILAHFVVLLVLVVIPLSDIVLPIPLASMPSYVMAAALPPPPAPAPVPRSVTAPTTLTPAMSTVPTTAPDKITPEVPAPPSMDTGPGVEGGLPGAGVPGALGTIAMPAPPPVPEPPKAQGPIRVAQLPVPPRKTVDVRPIYPELARTVRKGGIVILEAVIDTSGRVTQLKVIRSEPLLDQAAVDAVRQWQYAPSTYGGRPVSVLMTITVNFMLQQ